MNGRFELQKNKCTTDALHVEKKESRMPQKAHIEHHFTGSEFVRDIVIGMSDGLTVPFALAVGLSGIANSTAIVIMGGLA